MRRFFIVSVLIALIALWGFGGAAFAHELILKPSKLTAAQGESLSVELQSTHRFIVKEEVENISRIQAGLFRGGAVQEAALQANEPELRIDFSVTVGDGGAEWIAANKDGEIYSVTNEGSKVGSRQELEAKGLKVLRASKTDKFAKVLINVSAEDENFSAAIGQELEVVPVTNPAHAKAGEYFDVKILYKGQPASVPVWATYDGFAPELDVTYAYYTESRSDGVARIKITAPGLWIVRAAKNGEPGTAGEFDTRNLTSILTLEVK